MILEGLKLMVVGMTTVVAFLSLMILLIQLAARLTKEATARELLAVQLEKENRLRERDRASLALEDADEDIVVIAAAVAAYEAEQAVT